MFSNGKWISRQDFRIDVSSADRNKFKSCISTEQKKTISNKYSVNSSATRQKDISERCIARRNRRKVLHNPRTTKQQQEALPSRKNQVMKEF